jgi:hypothetical protein
MEPYRRIPPLSPEGVEEILAESASPPADTPERRATVERMRRMAEVHARRDAVELDPTPPSDHEDFLAARAAGFRSMRRSLANRRRRV